VAIGWGTPHSVLNNVSALVTLSINDGGILQQNWEVQSKEVEGLWRWWALLDLQQGAVLNH